jgi:hypothetical protein
MKNVHRRGYFFLAGMMLVTLVGCDIKMIGENKTLSFHPSDCGAYTLGCHLDKPIALGSTVEVRINGTVDTEGLELVSEDSTLFAIEPSKSGHPRRFIVRAMGVGGGRLLAVDKSGETIDRIFVNTVESDRLRLRTLGNLPQEPEIEVNDVQTFNVSVNKTVSFLVGPDVGNEWNAMGKFSYQILAASEALVEAIAERDDVDVASGLIGFTMPEGTHELVLGTADESLQLNILFVGE